MYVPRSFRVEERAALHDLIRRHSFAVLFTQGDDGPFATHLPFMLDAERGENGTLVAHMARANPHWKSWNERTEALVVFQGPHAYISPSWYEEQETVPTWNYAAVHVYGTPRLVTDPAVLRAQVEALVHAYEPHVPEPWDLARAEPVMERLLQAIVGFEIPIRRIEGKFKFNQNRSRADQAGVAAALEHDPDPLVRGVAEIMRANLERDGR